MKHKHYDKLVAKAANMDLVVFCRDTYHGRGGWSETSNLPIRDGFDYYLCLPQHKEACMAWLNGCDVGYNLLGNRIGIRLSNLDNPVWDDRSQFMWDFLEFKILPKKEKRWIAICKQTHCVRDFLYKTLEEATRSCSPTFYTHHKVEVEV